MQSYSSLTGRRHESIQWFGLPERCEGVVWNLYMPDLYICGFACVAYVLRHAEISIQGNSEVFNR